MGFYPTTYTKSEFKKYITDAQVKETVIQKFDNLPETITKDGFVYAIYICVIFYSVGTMYSSYEINYYSEEKAEFLFPVKTYLILNQSINNIICNLKH